MNSIAKTRIIPESVGNKRGLIIVMRPKPLQDFLDAVLASTDLCVSDPNAQASLTHIGAALQTPAKISAKISDDVGTRLPVCDQLDEVTHQTHFATPELRRVADSFRALEPTLTWRCRSGDMLHASANFAQGHANAVIVGPGGVERRNDVRLGVSLLAPNVRYPDHSHPPDETYLVLTDGAFRHGDDDWVEPGIGGTFYNSPGIVHAMRSGDTPLLAFWLLWAGDGQGS